MLAAKAHYPKGACAHFRGMGALSHAVRTGPCVNIQNILAWKDPVFISTSDSQKRCRKMDLEPRHAVYTQKDEEIRNVKNPTFV